MSLVYGPNKHSIMAFTHGEFFHMRHANFRWIHYTDWDGFPLFRPGKIKHDEAQLFQWIKSTKPVVLSDYKVHDEQIHALLSISFLTMKHYSHSWCRDQNIAHFVDKYLGRFTLFFHPIKQRSLMLFERDTPIAQLIWWLSHWDLRNTLHTYL